MPFHIQPIREFLVRPAVPESLQRLPELAYNIIWSWEPIIRALFRRLDPTLWRECGYNPVLMLGRVSQATLEKAAADHRYLSRQGKPGPTGQVRLLPIISHSALTPILRHRQQTDSAT